MLRRARLLGPSIILSTVLLLPFSLAFAQVPPPNPPPENSAPPAGGPLLSPEQLDNLVAPVALYPDPLLGQVLAASTYPMEIVEAQQWLQRNSGLQGTQLMDAAKQQNWDPSVQALVALPDALRMLSANVQWTTDLGNAFLAQQEDVMNAVQRMRARAQANGRLRSGPQETVTDQTQGGQEAIEIQPANPDVINVPVYQPSYVWGPGAYPDLWYPDTFGYGLWWGPGVFLSGFFPGWWGWGGWGWGCGWFGHGLFVNAGFFNHWGFHGYGGFHGGFGGGFGGHEAWAHNPVHRGGVPYPSQAVASRFNSNRFAGSRYTSGGAAGANRQFSGRQFGGSTPGNAYAGRNSTGSWQHFNGTNRATAPTQSYRGGSGVPSQSYRGGNYGGAYNYGSRGAYANSPYSSRSYAPSYSGRSYSAPSYSGRSYSAPSYSGRSYSAPSYSGRSYSAPSYSGRSYSAPGYSAPRSYSAPHYSGGFSGGHSFSGGGGHFAGGGGGAHFGGGGGGHSGGGGRGGHR